MKEEIKSFLTKTLIVIFAIGIFASVAYVCNYETQTNTSMTLDEFGNSVNSGTINSGSARETKDTNSYIQREIMRPDECDSRTAFKAWASIKDKKEFANCWYDSFSYDGVVENKVSIMWIVCPKNMKGKLPDTLGTFTLNEVWPKRDIIYGYTCKWIDYSEVKTNE